MHDSRKINWHKGFAGSDTIALSIDEHSYKKEN